MKRNIILGLSCLALLCGCNNDTKKQVEDTNEKYIINPLMDYIGILEGTTNYYDTYNKKEVNALDIKSFKDTILENPLTINSFAAISIFDDVNNQSIILKSDNLGYIILGKVDNTINGYYFYTREMINIKNDGTYMTSSSLNEEAVCKLNKFYIPEMLANTKDGNYYINRSQVSKEAYDKYVNDFNEKEDLKFKDFNNSNINELKKG